MDFNNVNYDSVGDLFSDDLYYVAMPGDLWQPVNSPGHAVDLHGSITFYYFSGESVLQVVNTEETITAVF